MQRISVSQAILDIKVHDIMKTTKDEITLRIIKNVQYHVNL